MIFFHFLFLITVTVTTSFPQKAVIVVPIADLVGQPMRTFYPNCDIKRAYQNLPVCGGVINPLHACPRMHQLVYNDIVDIIRMEEQEVCIKTGDAFYYTQLNHQPHSTYWTLKENIMPLTELVNKKINLNHLPDGINFADENSTAMHNPTVITLITPHTDKKTKQTFSAGTRFVCAHNKRKKRKVITAYALDYKNMKEYKVIIPAEKCTQTVANKTKEEHITDFVSLIKKWASTNDGIIPYVWGGTTYSTMMKNHYTEITQIIDGKESTYYQFAQDNSSPKSGLDCTGLVVRAAHLCGIPYFCKNSSTIARCLQQLSVNESVSAGDLIIIRGHVMIISDVENNLLIEARSYAHGYGKLQEISVDKVFEGINTYTDLIAAYFKKQKVKRKDSDGKIRDFFDDLKIVKMASAWK